MCIILIGRITREQHELALAQNRDGFSLFTASQGLIKCPTKAQVDRVLDEEEFGIWHYRIGTSGRINKADTYNVHPFRICDSKYLLYHNGVLGDGLGQMSDTHALAETLKDVSITTARTVIQALSGHNKFVIVSATDPTKFEIYGDWSCDAGVLMSHKLYKPVELEYYGGDKRWKSYTK